MNIYKTMEIKLENTPRKAWQYHLNEIKNCPIQLNTFVIMTAASLTEMADRPQQVHLTVQRRCTCSHLPSHICGAAMMCRALVNLRGQFLPSRSMQPSWKQGHTYLKIDNSVKQ